MTIFYRAQYANASLCSCSQAEIHDIFGRVGPVQTVIINKEKRHAFVKMLTRESAIEAKRAMGEYKSGGLALRVSSPFTFNMPTACKLLLTGIDPLGRWLRSPRLL